MLRDDNRYCSSFHFSVIFLNILFYNRNDGDDDINVNTDVDDDGDNNVDTKYDNDSDEIFLTENISRFMVRGTPFASFYV